jgi:hypothetical protein
MKAGVYTGIWSPYTALTAAEDVAFGLLALQQSTDGDQNSWLVGLSLVISALTGSDRKT